MTHSLLLRILALSATAAVRAGRIIRDVRATGDLRIVEKAKNDIQTVADRSSEKCIVASLRHKFPDLTIIGEEGQGIMEIDTDWIVKDYDEEILSSKCTPQYEKVPIEDIVVWIDPLDATKEYARGFVEYVTVLIGVTVKGKPIGGIIHQPYYKATTEDKIIGRTLWGIVGCGFGGFKANDPPTAGLVVLTTRTHSTEIVEKAIKALNPDRVIRIGGAGCKMAVLAEGKAHVYLYASQGCMKWDICGPEAVITAVGGKLTDVHGVPYRYHKHVGHVNRGGVLATARGVDHEKLASKVPEEVRKILV